MPDLWSLLEGKAEGIRSLRALRALAKLEHSCPELMDAAMQHVLRLGTEYTPQSDANMLWACATMKFPPTDIFLGTVLGHALNHLKDFTPQNLANITWSIATLALPVLKCKVNPYHSQSKLKTKKQ